jgi:hypothetical protein
MRKYPLWILALDWLLPEDPLPTGALKPPRPRLRTRIRDWLGVPRPPDEPKGFEWL